MVGKLYSTVLSIFLILALVGCGAEGGGSEGTGSVHIRGAVTDSVGNPVPEASILALTTGETAISDLKGEFQIKAYKDGETFTVTTAAGTFSESTDSLVDNALYNFEITTNGKLVIKREEESLADPINESNNDVVSSNKDNITTGGESKPNKDNQNRDDDEITLTVFELNADVTLDAGNGVTVGNVILPSAGTTLESPVAFTIISAGQEIQLSKVANGKFTAEITTKHFFLKVSYNGIEIASGRVNLTGNTRQAGLSFRINVDNSEAIVTAVQSSNNELNYDLKFKEEVRQREDQETIVQTPDIEVAKNDLGKEQIKNEIPVDLIASTELNVNNTAGTPQDDSLEPAPEVTETPVSETPAGTSSSTPSSTTPTGPKLGK